MRTDELALSLLSPGGKNKQNPRILPNVLLAEIQGADELTGTCWEIHTSPPEIPPKYPGFTV